MGNTLKINLKKAVTSNDTQPLNTIKVNYYKSGVLQFSKDSEEKPLSFTISNGEVELPEFPGQRWTDDVTMYTTATVYPYSSDREATVLIDNANDVVELRITNAIVHTEQFRYLTKMTHFRFSQSEGVKTFGDFSDYFYGNKQIVYFQVGDANAGTIRGDLSPLKDLDTLIVVEVWNTPIIQEYLENSLNILYLCALGYNGNIEDLFDVWASKGKTSSIEVVTNLYRHVTFDFGSLYGSRGWKKRES